MNKIDYIPNFGTQQQREQDLTVAIFNKVTPEEWFMLPTLCSAFYNHFEVGLMLQPILNKESKLEVWFIAMDTLDLVKAESFVYGFVSNLSRCIGATATDTHLNLL